MAEKKAAGHSKKELIELYKTMVRMRAFEEKTAKVFFDGKLYGNIHVCVGQEATEAGAMHALKPGDYISSTHRGHGHLLAKGGDTKKMMAELFGRETGYCHGKGGSMHMADVDTLHSLGANGIVGAGIPIATGSALASKMLGDKNVTVCFFGDGASNQGTFHESINMAATLKLPVVYVCENNNFGVGTTIWDVINTDSIAIRGKAYDIPGVIVDGFDAVAVMDAVKSAADRARKGEGPTIVECRTDRYYGHYCGDPAVYRDKNYVEKVREEHDALDKMCEVLKENGVTQKEIDEINAAAEKEMDDAVAYAEASPFPEADEILKDNYAVENERCVER